MNCPETVQRHARLRHIRARLKDVLHPVINFHADRHARFGGALAEAARIVAQDLEAAGMDHDRREIVEAGEHGDA